MADQTVAAETCVPSPMDVGAHPDIGLQTVTWLLDGELVHYDSLGTSRCFRILS